MIKLNSLAILAIAAIGLFACAKAEAPTPEDTESPETPAVVSTHTVTFEVGNPETKTAIVEHGSDPATYVWSASDAARLAVFENGVAANSITLNFSGDPVDYSTATVTASFDDQDGPYVYTANYAGSRTAGGNPQILTTQNPSATNYDPSADILIAKPTDPSATIVSPLSMRFKRVVVPNKMTLKGLTAGETVSTVVIKSDGSHNIGGYYNLSSESWAGTGKAITVICNQVVPASGMIDVWFVTRVVSGVTLTVVANTAENTYSKTFGSTIDFEEGSYTVFGVNALTKEAKVADGNYILTNKAKNKLAAAWVSEDTKLNAIDAESVDDVVYFNPDIAGFDKDNATISIARVTDSESEYFGLYTMRQNGLYLYSAADGIKAKAELDVNSYWDISNSAGNWTISASLSENNKDLQYNSNRFNCYSSSQTAVALVPVANVKTTPAITLNNGASLDADATAASNVDMGVGFNSATTSVSATIYDDSTCETAFTGDWLSVSADTDGATYSTLSTNSTGATRTAYVKIVATNANRSVTTVITIVQGYTGAVTSYYRKITSSASLINGDYLIVYESGSLAFNGGLSTIDVSNNTIPVTIDEGKIVANSTTDAAKFSITTTDGISVICSASGYYIGNSTAGNTVSSHVSTQYRNEISFSDGDAAIVAIQNATHSYLRYNATSGQERFRFYTSETPGSKQFSVQLYKRDN